MSPVLRLRSERELVSGGQNVRPMEGTKTSSSICDTSPAKKKDQSNLAWVHLLSTICTEWSQECMLIKQALGAQQTAVKVLGVTDNYQIPAETNGSLMKAPKTIHRCILKTSVTTKSSGQGMLTCHVCHVSYSDYNTYYRHLINNSCVNQPRVDRIVFDTSMSIYAQNKDNRTPKRSNSVPTTVQEMEVRPSKSRRLSMEPQESGQTFLIPAVKKEEDSDEEVFIIEEKRPKLVEVKVTNNNFDTLNGNPSFCDILCNSTASTSFDSFDNIDASSLEQNNNHSILDSGLIDPDQGKMFDEQDASETLLMLSTSNKNAESATSPAVAEAEVSSSINGQPLLCAPLLCPCEAASRLDRITQEEADKDMKEMEMLESKLFGLLSVLLGEKRMTGLGHPSLSPTTILEKVLRLTGTMITCEDDLCTDSCKKNKEVASNDDQLRFRKMKSKRAALEINTEEFVKICIPHENVWNSLGWRGKKISYIISQIVDHGLPVLQL